MCRSLEHVQSGLEEDAGQPCGHGAQSPASLDASDYRADDEQHHRYQFHPSPLSVPELTGPPVVAPTTDAATAELPEAGQKQNRSMGGALHPCSELDPRRRVPLNPNDPPPSRPGVVEDLPPVPHLAGVGLGVVPEERRDGDTVQPQRFASVVDEV